MNPSGDDRRLNDCLSLTSADDFFKDLWTPASPDGLIAFGTFKGTKTRPLPHPSPLMFSPVREAGRTLGELREGKKPKEEPERTLGELREPKEPNGLHFVQLNVFGHGLLPHLRERGDIGKTHRERLKALKAKGEPCFLKVCNVNLKEIAAFNLDLDVGREPAAGGERLPTADEALKIVLGLVGRGDFPEPSFVGFSGRGLYAGYALASHLEDNEKDDVHTLDAIGGSQRESVNHFRESPYGLPEASRENQKAIQGIVRGLAARCKELGLNPDSSAANLVQWFKCPDSLHPKTGQPIRFYLPHGLPMRRYTLRELEPWSLGKGSTKTVLPCQSEGQGGGHRKTKWGRRQRNTKRGQSQGRRNTERGQAAIRPFRKRLKDLEALASHRQPITEGQKRDTWLWIYFNAVFAVLVRSDFKGNSLRQAARAEAVAATASFNREFFSPPLPEAVVEDIGKGGCYRFTNETLAERLGVTLDEARSLGLECVAPLERLLEVREARKARTKAARRARAKEHREAKKAFNIERLKQMRQARDEGKTLKEIALAFALSTSQVKRLLGKPG